MLDIQQIRACFIVLSEQTRILFLFALITLSLNSFSRKDKIKYLLLPKVVKLNDSTFIDEAEISNQDWREYYNWNIKVFGDSVAKIKCGISDKFERLDTVLSYGEPYARYYFKHPAYNDYPKIGISYQQAIEYCNWRADKFYENELIKNKIIKLQQKEDSINYFTIDKFLNETFKSKNQYLSLLQTIPIIKYQLPSLEEYKSFEGNAYENYITLINIKKPPKGLDLYSTTTTNVYNNFQNKLGIYNLIGNVSEMTNIDGIAYGGNWTMKEIPKNYTTVYSEPTIWLGFRCIAIKTKFTDYQSVYNKTIDQ